MIFDAATVRGIQQQRITRLYLPAKSDKEPIEIGGTIAVRERVTEQIGDRTKASNLTRCHVEVASLRLAQLCDATDQDARAAGFTDRWELWESWKERHGETAASIATGEFRRYDVRVWVLDITLNDRRYLADWSRGANNDYTHSPGGAPPGERDEVPDDAWLDEHARERREAFESTRQDELDRRETQRLTAKLRDAKARARKTGVDLSPEVAQIERQLDAMERKLEAAA